MTTRRPGDPPSLIADPSRARDALHWSAKRSLEEMVASAWKWLHSGKRQEVSEAPADMRTSD